MPESTEIRLLSYMIEGELMRMRHAALRWRGKPPIRGSKTLRRQLRAKYLLEAIEHRNLARNLKWRMAERVRIALLTGHVSGVEDQIPFPF